MFITSMTDDITNNYKAMNEFKNSEMDEPEFFKQFHETIHLHSITKQLSTEVVIFGSVYSTNVYR